MSRFETTFAQLHAQNEGAFVPFVTLCDPTFDRSFDIICTLVDNEADALELGFPFSDPLLDGPVIQAANNRALNAGHSTEDSFKLLEKVRSKYPEIPMSLLLCANLIFAKGLIIFISVAPTWAWTPCWLPIFRCWRKTIMSPPRKDTVFNPFLFARRMQTKKPFKMWRKIVKVTRIWFPARA